MAQVFKRFNLSVVTRKYTDNNGVEKSRWERIGQMTTFKREDGTFSTIMELFHMPGTVINVFEQKERETQPPAFTGDQDGGQKEYDPFPEPQDDIKVEDIPFD